MVVGLALITAALVGAPCDTYEITYLRGKVTFTGCPAALAEEGYDVDCERGCFLGLTVRTADGRQLDVAAKPVKHADVETPVVISGEVGPGALEYQVALWRTKRQPCQVDAGRQPRHGCKAYGYELDELVWGLSFNEMDQLGSFMALPGRDPNQIEILDAGGGAKAVQSAKLALSSLTIDGQPAVIKSGTAQSKRDLVEILYRAKWHRVVALRMLDQLQKAGVGIRWRATHWAEATAAFVIAVGAP